MYKEAQEAINNGLSLGARIALGFSSLLLAAMLITIDTPSEKALFVHSFACFCLLITIACFVKGRPRQFIGSFIGIGLFLISVCYLGSQLSKGVFWSDSRGEPSVVNAFLFMLAFGIPGIAYTIKAKFGFKRP